ncbi:MAG: hypothetical protein SPI65_05340 [Peptoniphilus sp.]|nr:hypothetical protein [Peptoniphilus sp.]MDD7362616.1 hypothetical protein [Bacillota bacterium]MDY6044985.1 hypothetical protein [Peptoniphilus sp.]
MISLPSIHTPPVLAKDELRRREIYRYLRLNGTPPDDTTKDAVETDLARLFTRARVAHTADLFRLKRCGDLLAFGDFTTSSEALKKNLATSEYVVAFAMTLGDAVDRLISRLMITSKADAFITDACATELLESYANRYCANIRDDARRYGLTTRPRFSPGFADFGLEHQAPLIRLLDADKNIHIALSEGGMLIPAKTVTAVMGIDREETR